MNCKGTGQRYEPFYVSLTMSTPAPLTQDATLISCVTV